ncbi:hypothetical protein D9M72_281160 [compost metagenome]
MGLFLLVGSLHQGDLLHGEGDAHGRHHRFDIHLEGLLAFRHDGRRHLTHVHVARRDAGEEIGFRDGGAAVLEVLLHLLPAFIGDAQVTGIVLVAGENTGEYQLRRGGSQTSDPLIACFELVFGPQVRPVLRCLLRGELIRVVAEHNGLLNQRPVGFVVVAVCERGIHFACPGRLIGLDRTGRFDLGEVHVVEAEGDVRNGVVLLGDQFVGRVCAAGAHNLNLEAGVRCLFRQPLPAALSVGVGVHHQGVARGPGGGGISGGFGSRAAGAAAG